MTSASPLQTFTWLRTAAAFAALAFAAAAVANPFDWIERKLFGNSGHSKPYPAELRDPGPIVLKPGQPVHFWIDDAAPEAELPKGRSHFRRIEVQGTVERAHVRIATIAHDAASEKGHVVFKPLIYVLAEDGDVREMFEPDPLALDIRPFKRTRLNACIVVEKLQRFLVATSNKSLGSAFQSDAREDVKAPTQGGFYYRTESLKVKLPYAPTGELVLSVLPAVDDPEPCGVKPKDKRPSAEPGQPATRS